MSHFPNFFVVGAPKCGTSTLHYWLSQHPQLFLPSAEKSAPDYWLKKEPNYYATDLGLGPEFCVHAEKDYLAMYAEADVGVLTGDASPSYLYSDAARARIHADNAEAKIIIQLRNPADFVRSLHFALFRHDKESYSDLAKAVRVRKSGVVPAGAQEPYLYNYVECALFSRYVEKYLETFGQDQVLITRLEDMSADTNAYLDRIYRFLGVDTFVPEFEVRNKADYRLNDSEVASVVKNKIPGISMINRFLPGPVKKFGVGLLETHVLGTRELGEPSSALRQEILRDVAHSTRQLEDITGLDLGDWLPKS
jgi:hypothetical protein